MLRIGLDMFKKHGEYIRGGDVFGGRWCETCGQSHGSLYACPHYSPEALEEIKLESDKEKWRWPNNS